PRRPEPPRVARWPRAPGARGRPGAKRGGPASEPRLGPRPGQHGRGAAAAVRPAQRRAGRGPRAAALRADRDGGPAAVLPRGADGHDVLHEGGAGEPGDLRGEERLPGGICGDRTPAAHRICADGGVDGFVQMYALPVRPKKADIADGLFSGPPLLLCAQREHRPEQLQHGPDTHLGESHHPVVFPAAHLPRSEAGELVHQGREVPGLQLGGAVTHAVRVLLRLCRRCCEDAVLRHPRQRVQEPGLGRDGVRGLLLRRLREPCSGWPHGQHAEAGRVRYRYLHGTTRRGAFAARHVRAALCDLGGGRGHAYRLGGPRGGLGRQPGRRVPGPPVGRLRPRVQPAQVRHRAAAVGHAHSLRRQLQQGGHDRPRHGAGPRAVPDRRLGLADGGVVHRQHRGLHGLQLREAPASPALQLQGGGPGQPSGLRRERAAAPPREHRGRPGGEAQLLRGRRVGVAGHGPSGRRLPLLLRGRRPAEGGRHRELQRPRGAAAHPGPWARCEVWRLRGLRSQPVTALARGPRGRGLRRAVPCGERAGERRVAAPLARRAAPPLAPDEKRAGAGGGAPALFGHVLGTIVGQQRKRCPGRNSRRGALLLRSEGQAPQEDRERSEASPEICPPCLAPGSPRRWAPHREPPPPGRLRAPCAASRSPAAARRRRPLAVARRLRSRAVLARRAPRCLAAERPGRPCRGGGRGSSEEQEVVIEAAEGEEGRYYVLPKCGAFGARRALLLSCALRAQKLLWSFCCYASSNLPARQDHIAFSLPHAAIVSSALPSVPRPPPLPV
ncbi:unnamed protein product, partial [Prorocentrum cordatum]